MAEGKYQQSEIEETKPIEYGVKENGWTYFGNIINKRIRGIGLQISPKGQIQEGFFNIDLNGYGRAIYPSAVYYIGFFKNGKREGRGKMIYTDGFTKEGDWLADKFQEHD